MILIYFILLLFKTIQSENIEIPEKKNIQTLTNKSLGYIPIEEILKRVNLSRIQTTSRYYYEIDTKNIKNTSKNLSASTFQPFYIPQNVIKTLLTGSDEEVLQIPYKMIMDNLKMIDTVLLSETKKAIIWDLIRNHVPFEKMNVGFLKETNGLWYDIPEHDLVKFDIHQEEMLNYLGSSKLLKRRQAAILAYAIKKREKAILQNAEYINKLKGLICGFPEIDLANISSSVFLNINGEVFQNIWPCTLEQVKVLLNNAIKPDTYGPLEVWTKEIFEKLSLVVTIIKPYEFRKLNAEVFKGLNIKIMDLMSDEQLGQFTDDQVANLNENVLMSYYLRMNNYELLQDHESKCNRIKCGWLFIFILVLCVF